MALSTVPHGPLQAFASMQRALRDTEKRASAVSHELVALSEAMEGKLLQLNKKAHHQERKLRESKESLADLEELVMQMYREHGKMLTEHRESMAAAQAQQETAHALSHAAAVQQQKQYDDLSESVRRLSDTVQGHITASGNRLSKLESQVSALETSLYRPGGSVTADRFDAQFSALEDALKARQDEATARVNENKLHIDSMLHRWMELEETKLHINSKLDQISQRLEKCEVRAESNSEMDSKLGVYLQQVRDETNSLMHRKVDVNEVHDRCKVLEARFSTITQQFQPIVTEVGSISSNVQLLRSRLESREAREVKLIQKQQEAAHALDELASRVSDTRSIAQANQQGLNALGVSQQELEVQIRSLQATYHRLSTVTDDQGRSLNSIADTLQEHNVVPQKTRSHALLLPVYTAAREERSALSPFATPTRTFPTRPHLKEV